MGYAYLIRIPNQKNRLRAIEAFLKVRQPRCGFTDYRMLVTQEHMDVLQKEGIPYEDITDVPEGNGKKKKQAGEKAPRSS